jgi:hypothetical protein
VRNIDGTCQCLKRTKTIRTRIALSSARASGAANDTSPHPQARRVPSTPVHDFASTVARTPHRFLFCIRS